MKLDYIPPVIKDGNVMAKLMIEDSHKMSKSWDHIVALFIAGLKTVVPRVHRYVTSQ